MQQTIETPAPLRQTSLQLPAILSDAEMRWLGDHNESLTIEQTADGLLIRTPATGSRGNRGEIRLVTELTNWNDRVQFGEIRGVSGGLLLPKGGRYQADAFVIATDDWAKVPMEHVDDVYPTAWPPPRSSCFPRPISPRPDTPKNSPRNSQTTRPAQSQCRALAPEEATRHHQAAGTRAPISKEKILTFPELPGLELNAGLIYADSLRRFAFEPWPDEA